MFMRFGIKSVSMDNISSELGMSKKTLYTYFKDKRELVNESVGYHFDCDQKQCGLMMSSTHNAIEQLLKLAQHLSQNYQEINPSTLFDLRKYYPSSWKLFIAHKEVYIVDQVKTNIQLGQKSGLYRPEIDSDVIAKFYIELVEASINPDVFPLSKQPYINIAMQLMDYHLHALLTDQGRAELHEFKQIKYPT
ncbi:MAG: AcrR family transcriptional regulator [Bacteroidia bacterium]|jgi:AcrR family transcriptional regulator